VPDASKLELVRDSALAVELTGDQCRVLTALMDVLDLADGEILVKSGASDNRGREPVIAYRVMRAIFRVVHRTAGIS
jgi:hypothetical protein